MDTRQLLVWINYDKTLWKTTFGMLRNGDSIFIPAFISHCEKAKYNWPCKHIELLPWIIWTYFVKNLTFGFIEFGNSIKVFVFSGSMMWYSPSPMLSENIENPCELLLTLMLIVRWKILKIGLKEKISQKKEIPINYSK